MKLSVQLVTWNGAKYISHLFASLRAQTHADWALHVLDNGSTDGTAAVVTAACTHMPVPVTVEHREQNSGFVGGHNRLFSQYGDADAVFLVNQDMMLEPDCIAQVAQFMETHPRAAACSPRLMRWDPATGEKSDRIDTLGLQPYRTGRVVDWMHGHRWEDGMCDFLPHRTAVVHGGREECAVEVFGVSGAMPCFRAAALRGLPGECGIFDEHFFSYKEDVDLAWRLRWMGWKAYVLPHAVAYHDRTAAGPDGEGDVAAAQHWKTKSALVRRYSYRNHWFTLIKNAPLTPRVLWFELKKFAYLLLREPAIIRFCGQQKLLKTMWNARRAMRRARRAHPIELARWMI
ncbi:MAG: glycosyltransferase family 2 protein [Patescibacteria group bacterium]